MKEKIEKILQEGLAKGIFTEVDLSVRSSSSEIFHTSFSRGNFMAEYGKRIFDTASVTKMILTLLVYRLLTVHEMGEFSIDAPVNRFIDISGPHTEELTVYDLVTFHAEFNRFTTQAEMMKKIIRVKNPKAPFRPTEPLKVFPEMLREIKSVGLRGRPGTSFRYGNVHSILLGFVLESAFKKGLEDLIREYLLIPLGLADTSTDPTGKLNRCVKSHYKVQLGRPSDSVAHLSSRLFSRLLGSAGLFSSTSDLLLVLDMVLLGDQHPTCHIRDEFASKLHLPVTPGGKFGQGFGLWSEFIKNLEEFHPDPPADLVFRSGFSGMMCACSRREQKSFVLAANFTHKRRTPQKATDDRRSLHETYARIASCVFA